MKIKLELINFSLYKKFICLSCLLIFSSLHLLGLNVLSLCCFAKKITVDNVWYSHWPWDGQYTNSCSDYWRQSCTFYISKTTLKITFIVLSPSVILGSQDRSGWMGPQEVSSPSSCSKQSHLEVKHRCLRFLSSCVFNTSKAELLQVFDYPPGSKVYICSGQCLQQVLPVLSPCRRFSHIQNHALSHSLQQARH